MAYPMQYTYFMREMLLWMWSFLNRLCKCVPFKLMFVFKTESILKGNRIPLELHPLDRTLKIPIPDPLPLSLPLPLCCMSHLMCVQCAQKKN